MKNIIITLYIAIFTFVASASQTQQYYAIYFNSAKVGHSVHTRISEPNKITTTEYSNLEIKRGMFSLNISTQETYYETPEGKPIGFESVENMSGQEKHIVGKIDDDMMNVEFTSNGNTSIRELPFPSDAIMPDAARKLALENGLESGTKLNLNIFSPSMLTALDTEIIIGEKEMVDLLGRVVELTRTESTINALTKIRTVAYIDDLGEPMKMIMPIAGINIEIIACEKQVALSPSEEFNITETTIVSPVKIKKIDKIKSIVYTINTEDINGLSFVETAFQKSEKNSENVIKLTVMSQDLKKSKQQIPYTGNDVQAISALKPNMYIESNNPEIKTVAKKAIDKESNALKAALKIERFVYDYINKKDLSAGYATALEVLRSKQGDCTEHAVLTAALCRAVGIPAKMAVGIVYADAFAGSKNIFGMHAWTVAYIDGQWINLDATRADKSNGFDPTHITFHISNGAASDFLDIVSSLAGGFEISSIQIEY